MLEAYMQAWGQILAPMNMLFLFIGVVFGVVLGITPGLGALIGVSLVMSVVWGMEAGPAILMLVAIHATVMTGGSIPAVLMGIPGAPTNVITTVDGYPMAQKGEGARAVGAALFSSMLSGVVGVVLALVMIPVVIPLVLMMKSPEMTLLMLLGLCFLAVATGGREGMLKNLVAGMFGMLVALIGFNHPTGTVRYTFGASYLMYGIDLTLIALGIFAVGELMDVFLKEKAAIATAETAKVKIRDTLEGVKDIFRHWGLFLRSSIIGYFFGVIPGIGGANSVFVCYGLGKRFSKHPDEWGKGCVEGVIAPESANNSSVGGATLTTMAFGIPGDPVLALIMGTFMILGVTPGREMVTQNLDFLLLILIGIAVANILAVLLTLPFISQLAKVTLVPYKFLFCIILAVVAASTYANKMAITDVYAIIFLGVIGLGLKRFGYSLACFILGFVLGSLLEYYMWQSLVIYGPLFFLSSPICITFIVLMVCLFLPYERLKVALSKARGKIFGR